MTTTASIAMVQKTSIYISDSNVLLGGQSLLPFTGLEGALVVTNVVAVKIREGKGRGKDRLKYLLQFTSKDLATNPSIVVSMNYYPKPFIELLEDRLCRVINVGGSRILQTPLKV